MGTALRAGEQTQAHALRALRAGRTLQNSGFTSSSSQHGSAPQTPETSSPCTV